MAYDRSNSGTVIQGPMTVSKRDSYETEMVVNKQIPYRISRTSKGYFAANSAASPGDLRAIAVYFSGWNWAGTQKSSSPLDVCWYPYVLNLDANGGTFTGGSTLISGKQMYLPIVNRNQDGNSSESKKGKDVGTASNCVLDSATADKPYAVIPKRDGWKFAGWSTSPDSSQKISTFGNLITEEEILKGQICYKVFSTSSAASVTSDASEVPVEAIVGEGTATLYAKWEQQDYTVKVYYPVVPDSWQTNVTKITFTYGKELPSAPEGTLNPRCTGYIFHGIYTEENGGGTCYYNESMVPQIEVYNGEGASSKNVLKLYAHYTPIDYSIVFKSGTSYGSGTLPDPINLKYGQSGIIPNLSNYHMDGYTFIYWANTSDEQDETKYRAGDVFTNLTAVNGKTIVMTAQWQVNTYKLTYSCKNSVIFENHNEGNLNPSGTVSPDRYANLKDVWVPFGTACKITEYEPIIFGYDFLGWKLFTSENGSLVERRFLKPGEVFPWSYKYSIVAKPVFVVSPTVDVCVESVIPSGKTSYRCLLYEDISDDDIILTEQVPNNPRVLTLNTDYFYTVLNENELEITVRRTDNNPITVELFGSKYSWHRGIPYVYTDTIKGTGWTRGNLYINKEGQYVR